MERTGVVDERASHHREASLREEGFLPIVQSYHSRDEKPAQTQEKEGSRAENNGLLVGAGKKKGRRASQRPYLAGLLNTLTRRKREGRQHTTTCPSRGGKGGSSIVEKEGSMKKRLGKGIPEVRSQKRPRLHSLGTTSPHRRG